MKKLVISLNKTPERYEAFKRWNAHLSNFQRLAAHDGRTEDKTRHPDKFSPNLDYSPGALGCALSHIELWQEIAAGAESVTVLEDDAVTHREFDTLSQEVIDSLPGDWDLMVWGWNFDCPLNFDMLPGVSPSLAYFLQDGLASNLEAYQALQVTLAVFPLKFCFGTPAYSISPAGAAKLLGMLLPLRPFEMKTSTFTAHNKGIDVALCSAYERLRAYVSFPPLAVTPNDHSISTTRSKMLEGQSQPPV